MSVGYYWCHMCKQYVPDDIPKAEDWVRFHSTCLLDDYSSWGQRMEPRSEPGKVMHMGQGEDVPEGYSCPVDPLTLLAMAAHSYEDET